MNNEHEQLIAEKYNIEQDLAKTYSAKEVKVAIPAFIIVGLGLIAAGITFYCLEGFGIWSNSSVWRKISYGVIIFLGVSNLCNAYTYPQKRKKLLARLEEINKILEKK